MMGRDCRSSAAFGPMLNGFPLASYAQICLKTIFPHGWLFCITHAVIGAGSGMAAETVKGTAFEII